jgi:serine/threonine-protein kinase
VLPFQNLSDGGPYAYFAGGLHDELLTQLAKVEALTVMGRTSVMTYADGATPLSQIADELNVGSIVEGSVQIVGDRLRVNAQLIDPESGGHRWAESYDRTLDDAFAVQREVAQQVVASVGAELSEGEADAIAWEPTQDPEAYRLYLQAREYYGRPGFLRSNLEISQRLYERALTLDPDFALAHASLSEVHGYIRWYGYDFSQERARLQRQEAEAALRLAPRLPQAHLAIGLVHYWVDRDYHLALGEFQIAQNGLPNDAYVLSLIGFVNRRLGNWDEVFSTFEKAAQQDPRDSNLFYDLGGGTFLFTRRYADALQAYDRALAVAPDLRSAAVRKGETYVRWKGELDTLRSALDPLPLGTDLGWLGTAAAVRAQLLLWERNADDLLTLLQRTGMPSLETQILFLPASLLEGWAYEIKSDHRAAQEAFGSALVLLDSLLVQRPDDLRLHAARGQALAGLGNHDEAVSEADFLQQSPVYQGDALDGRYLAEVRALILAGAGELDEALAEIERLLSGPGSLSVQTLQLDPRWDPLRDHPRFEALLEEYRDDVEH